MKVEDFKKGCGFIVEGISFGCLCDCLADHSGVTFTDRRRFFWGAADIRSEFLFHGYTFKVEPWDIDDSIFVSPKDEGVERPEIAELRDHVARLSANDVVKWQDTLGVMKRSIALKILNCAAALVALGGCFDMLLPSIPSNLLVYLNVTEAEMPPHLSSLLLGLLRALGGCLFAIGMTAFLIINGPLKRDERWAPWALLIMIGLSEGINASQMWRFGSPYYAPLSFVALTVVGVVILPKQSERKS